MVNKYRYMFDDGQRFGTLTILSRATNYRDHVRYLVRCDCGEQSIRRANRIAAHRCSSCARTKHGDTVRAKKRPAEYSCWLNMKSRCLNPNHNSFKNYGARGIAICDRWFNSYENFLADMGRRPSSEHSIDRIDNDGNYEPANCRWATKSEQMYNTRRQAA